ncbi:MAG: hypothetical protein H6572_07865 [Lewinellaceae bacterium]|nr:hypothetical protein [Lewinellaceae bacterium]
MMIIMSESQIRRITQKHLSPSGGGARRAGEENQCNPLIRDNLRFRQKVDKYG